MPQSDRRRAENKQTALKAAPRVAGKKRSGGSLAGGMGAELLNLQRSAGNRAVVSLLAQTEGHEQPSVPVQRWTLDGKAIKAADKYALVPQPVPNGKGVHKNLKENAKPTKPKTQTDERGRKKRLPRIERAGHNTAFWKLHGFKPTVELHVHYGLGGGLSSGVASHFKENGEQLDLVSNTDLVNTFQSDKPRAWKAKGYFIR
jgi:hypothetical protein